MSKPRAPFTAKFAFLNATALVFCALAWTSAAQQLRSAAIAARTTIEIDGSGVIIDSYDSRNPFWSNYGRYDPNHVRDNGDVLCNGALTNSIMLGSAGVYGHVATGPGGGAVLTGTGSIGSHAWQASHPGEIEPNGMEGRVWYSHDSDFVVMPIVLPYNAGLPAGPGALIVTTNFSISSNYVGSSSVYPDPPPWSGVTTNIGYVTVSIYPDPPPPMLATNTVATNSSSYPAVGTFIGNVSTNVVSTMTTNYPSAGTYLGAVVTNTAAASSNSPPAAGTYIGNVTTNYNCSLHLNQPVRPADGTYVPGSLVHRSNGNWDYCFINSILYSFSIVAGYEYSIIAGYTYNLIVRYSYPVFTYNYATYATNNVYQTNYYDHVLSSGDHYYAGALSGATIVLGTARLVLPSGLNMTSTNGITIANGGRLVVYAGGTSLLLSSSAVINTAGYPGDFFVLAAPTVTSVSITLDAQFAGVVAAPDADIAVNAGGGSPNDYSGALIGHSVRLNGPLGFHYDESLALNPLWPVGPPTPAVLTAASVGPDGFQFVVSGVAGFAYEVQASANLIEWTTIGSGNAPFTFSDAASTNFPARFYRALVAP